MIERLMGSQRFIRFIEIEKIEVPEQVSIGEYFTIKVNVKSNYISPLGRGFGLAIQSNKKLIVVQHFTLTGGEKKTMQFRGYPSKKGKLSLTIRAYRRWLRHIMVPIGTDRKEVSLEVV